MKPAGRPSQPLRPPQRHFEGLQGIPMKVRFVSTLCLAFPLVAVHFGGCGSNSGSSTFDPNNPNGDLGLTTGSGSMTGGLTGGTITSGTGMGSGTGSGGNPLDPDAACAAQAQDTRPSPSTSSSCSTSRARWIAPPRITLAKWCRGAPCPRTRHVGTRSRAPSRRSSTHRPAQVRELASGSSASTATTHATSPPTPADVAIAPLPGSAMAIIMAMGGHMPGGNTPDGPGAQGRSTTPRPTR